VARVNAWYDQTMDRVSERFTKYTHYVTVATAALVVLTVQLDMIAVVDRLSVDDGFRTRVVDLAIKDVGAQSSVPPDKAATPKPETSANSASTTQPPPTQPPSTQPTSTQPQPGATPQTANNAESPAPTVTTLPPATDKASPPNPQPTSSSTGVQTAKTADADTTPKLDADKYYNELSGAGLITLPLGYNWVAQLNWRKVPGMLIAALLISLGAPFWYNILKDLIGLRSSLAKKDDAQRQIRQTNQDVQPAVTAIAELASAAPTWLRGERGDLGAMG
jgi:hypothetical protein